MDTELRRISFGPAMVNAIVAGSKTVTRRFRYGLDTGRETLWAELPVGSKLLVREPFARQREEMDMASGEVLAERICYRADGEAPSDPAYIYDHAGSGTGTWNKVCPRTPLLNSRGTVPWSHPRYLPSWASRIRIRVLHVAPQRLHDLTDDDAIMEGATERACGWSMDWSRVGCWSRALGRFLTEADIARPTPRDAFATYWNWMHRDEAASWDANPPVVGITFAPEFLPHPAWMAQA